MDDTISRQAAIDALERIFDRCEEIEAHFPDGDPDKTGYKMFPDYMTVWKYLHRLPSAQPEQRWIPISEGPPKKRDWYLGIFKEPDTGWINPIPFICDYVGKETKATTKECWILKGFTDREEHINYYFNLKCIAWMSLPE